MDLKAAINICIAHSDPKHLQFGNVGARDGLLFASNGNAGCEVPCEAVQGLAFTVNGKHWAAQVQALGADVKLSVKDGKLITAGKGGKFSIQIAPEDQMPKRRERPKRGWRKYDAELLQGIAAIAPLVSDVPIGANQLVGLRFTPDWIGAASGQRGAVLWKAGVVEGPVTVMPDLFDGLSGAGEMVVQAASVWIKTDDGQYRWATPLEGDWPDDGMIQCIVGARARPHKLTLSLAELLRIAELAAVESDNGLAPIILEGGPGIIRLRGGPQGGNSDVDAAMDVEAKLPKGCHVGINPLHLLAAVRAVKEAVGGEETGELCFGEATEPVRLCNGDPAVETFVMPIYLEPAEKPATKAAAPKKAAASDGPPDGGDEDDNEIPF